MLSLSLQSDGGVFGSTTRNSLPPASAGKPAADAAIELALIRDCWTDIKCSFVGKDALNSFT